MGVVAVLVLIAIAGVALVGIKKLADAHPAGTKTNSISVAGQPSTTSSSSGSQTATNLDDFSAVCTGKTISNAAADQGGAPHPIQLFTPGVNGGSYVSSSVVLPATWQASYQNFATTQLVGCLTLKSASAQPIATCNFQSGSQPVNVGLYSATYNLSIYAAKTGKKLGTVQVTGTSTQCPYLATYDPSNPKIYADPDTTSIQPELEQYVMSQ